MFEVKAPEFEGIVEWINSEPLSMGGLKGKIVLIDFWTYTCVNCLRTVPYLKKWHEKYSKKGLVIIGVHTPEFDFEKDSSNVRKAVVELGIEYQIAIDSDRKTWTAFNNQCWPAKFLIDRDGIIKFVHFGEGDYNQTEKRIQALLGIKNKLEHEEPLTYVFDQSPECYAGYEKNSGLGSGMACDKDGCNVYIDPEQHEIGVIYPHGQWNQEKEYLELLKAPGKIAYRLNAREANIVIEPVGSSSEADIYIDGKKTGKLKISSSKMYNILKDKRYNERELEIVFNGKVRVFAFTFG